MSEGSFQASVLKYLNSVAGCTAENVSGNSQQSGRADINGVYLGKSFRIELKILDNYNKPTRKQLINLLKWFKSGSAICVAYCITDVERFILGFANEAEWSTLHAGACMSFGYYMDRGEKTHEFFKQYKQLHIQD